MALLGWGLGAILGRASFAPLLAAIVGKRSATKAHPKPKLVTLFFPPPLIQIWQPHLYILFVYSWFSTSICEGSTDKTISVRYFKTIFFSIDKVSLDVTISFYTQTQHTTQGLALSHVDVSKTARQVV